MSFDMNKMLEQVQQMQAQMQKAQEELKNETVQATAGGGMVTVTATGDGEISEIKIDPKAIDPDDPEMLEDMIVAAVNEALRSAHGLLEAKLGPALGGLHGLGLVRSCPAGASTSFAASASCASASGSSLEKSGIDRRSSTRAGI
jgi:DNA-binding YbaB/EbfC family protein